ncbi:MAG: cupin domain-containing protein [Rhodospirillales bacterium]
MTENATPTPPALDPGTVEPRLGSNYPEPHGATVAGREKRPLGDALGLRNFGVNLVRLPPGAMSSQRHCHSRQDEFVYILEGELALVTDAGEQTLRPGMAAGFPAGNGDCHHLVNRAGADAVYLEVGDRTEGDEVDYADIDMLVRDVNGERIYVHRDGTPY